MAEISGATPVQARCIGETAIIYASDYLNKLSGERIERECRYQLQSGCRALVINFQNTELVNSIGVSVLMGVIDAAERGTSEGLTLAPNKSMDASGGTVFRNLLGAADDALIRAAASTQPLGCALCRRAEQ